MHKRHAVVLKLVFVCIKCFLGRCECEGPLQRGAAGDPATYRGPHITFQWPALPHGFPGKQRERHHSALAGESAGTS